MKSLYGVVIPIVPALLAVSICMGGCDEPKSPTPPDEALIALLVDSFETSVEEQDLARVARLFADDFLHQGTPLEDTLTQLTRYADVEGLRWSFSQLRMDIDGRTATLDYLIDVKSCRNAPLAEDDSEAGSEVDAIAETCTPIFRCRSGGRPECDIWRDLRKVGEIWRFVGDQTPWTIGLRLDVDEAGLRLGGAIVDPSRDVTAIAGLWTGADFPVEFEEALPGEWHPVVRDAPPGYYPGGSLPWIIELTLEAPAGTQRTSKVFDAFNDAFAAGLYPNGEALQPITFRWDGGGPLTGGAMIDVYSGEDIIWRSPTVFEGQLNYGGPTLINGTTYDYQVSTMDLYGNRAVTGMVITPVDELVALPQPSEVNPSTGSASGGTEVTLLGRNFAEGVTVLFGDTNAEAVERVDSSQVRFVTPAMPEGVYDIIVANPGGRVGVLERGFTFLELAPPSDGGIEEPDSGGEVGDAGMDNQAGDMMPE